MGKEEVFWMFIVSAIAFSLVVIAITKIKPDSPNSGSGADAGVFMLALCWIGTLISTGVTGFGAIDYLDRKGTFSLLLFACVLGFVGFNFLVAGKRVKRKEPVGAGLIFMLIAGVAVYAVFR